MTCIGCQPTKPVLNCIATLTIGTLAPTTDYSVYFENSANGKITRIDDQSDADGLLSINLTPFVFTVGVQYRVWVTLYDASNTEAYETILVDGIEVTCMYATFKRLYDSGNSTITSEATQTLSI